MARGKKKEAALSPAERLQAALVPESEQPYKVPENWCWVYLKSISRIQTGKKDANYGSQDGEYPFFTCAAEPIRCHGYSFDSNAILLAGNGDINNISLYNGKFEAYQRTYVVEIVEPINTDYAFYWFKYRWFDFNKDKMFGTAIPYIRLGNLQEFPIPVPPLTQQQRIVDRIESLFTKLDEAKQKAQDALDSFETRKAAILHKAFTGDLTAQWRKERGLGMESWEDISWGAFISSIEAGKNWNAEGRPPQDNEFGVVKVSAVTWGEFNENESKTCTISSQLNEATQIHAGDFLFSRANTLQLVGNCVIVKNISKRLMLSDKILRFTFQSVVVPNFVLYYTKSQAYRIQVEQLASGNQDGMRNISQKNLKAIIFPVPKIEEQTEIVRILDDLLAKEQQAKEAAEKVLEQIDLTKKAILARAFRGELGTNDPSEESALELLKETLQKAERFCSVYVLDNPSSATYNGCMG